MKKTKNILLLMAVIMVSAIMFTSCLDDDNNKKISDTITLTKQEMVVRNQTLSGKWEGKLYFVNTEKQKSDSTYIVWVTDTTKLTITINDFPVSILANYVNNANLKELLAKAPTQPLVFNYCSFEKDYREYYNMYYFRYIFVPKDNKMTFKLNGDDVTVTFVESLSDMSNVYNPIAVHYKGIMSGNILLGDLNYKNFSYKMNTLLAFSGEQIGR
jgi:hypothetical protein